MAETTAKATAALRDNMPAIEYAKRGGKMTTASAHAIKDRFAAVNAWAEAQLEAQRVLSVPDPALRAELRRELVRAVFPKYKAFFDAHAGLKFSKKKTKMYLRYPPDMVSEMIGRFYEADGASLPSQSGTILSSSAAAPVRDDAERDGDTDDE